MPALTSKRDIEALRLRTVIRAIRLEQQGFRHSGGNIKPKWAKHLGLSPRASHDKVIETIEGMLTALEG
jgi:hypothetical protein